MALELHRLTREYVWWEISTPNDLASATVEIAFTDPAEIPDAWSTSTLVNENDAWYIRELVSGVDQGGDTELAPGDFQAWARITDAVERPVRKIGVVTIE